MAIWGTPQARPPGCPGTLLHLQQQLQCLQPVLSTGADGSCVGLDIGLQASAVVWGVQRAGNPAKSILNRKMWENAG